ncbi:MAG: hypothetical protein MJ252_19590 [archaeon]|nr:hypothetical protein [archaeon]
MSERQIDDGISSQSSHMQSGPKVESLLKELEKDGFFSNSNLTEKDIKNFLERHSNTKSGFDKKILKNLLESLEFNEDGEIPVSDFIDGYLGMEAEMRSNAKGTMAKIAEQEKNYEECTNNCRRYQQEKLNKEGFCENAKIEFTIKDIKMNEIIQDMKKVFLTLKYGNNQQEMEFKPGEDYEDNPLKGKKITFRPKKKDDPFQIIMKAIDEKGKERDLGAQEFKLDTQESQEEYDISIEIPGLEDESIPLASINAKILFYYSDFLYYEDQKKKSEKILDKLRNRLLGINKVINSMNKIYGLDLPEPQGLPTVSQYRENFEEESNKDQSKPEDVRRGGNKRGPSENPNEMIDSNYYNSNAEFIPNALEQNLPKERQFREIEEENYTGEIDKEKPSSDDLLKKLSYVLLGTSIISCLYKPDLINGLLGVFLYLYSTGIFNLPFLRNKKYLLGYDIGAIVYNLVWFFMNLKKKEGYEDNGLRITSEVLTAITAAVEGFIAYSLTKNKKNPSGPLLP